VFRWDLRTACGYLATRDACKRQMPAAFVGVSKDVHGNPACGSRWARANSISAGRRPLSNICTAQVLLAVMAAMYAVYHGPEGLRRIGPARAFANPAPGPGARRIRRAVNTGPVFDTLTIAKVDAGSVLAAAAPPG